MRKVPARIITRDYVGISTAASEKFWKAGERELRRLEQQVERGTLKQGVRRASLGDNVEVVATVTYDLRQAIITIGAQARESLYEDICYCCSPCVVAGVISKVKNSPDNTFLEDAHYYADIIICQSPIASEPKNVYVREERSSEGQTALVQRTIRKEAFTAEYLLDVPFSDYNHHEAGDSVLVLIQPAYDFSVYPALFSPCVNNRRVADEQVLNPRVNIATVYTNSSGRSCDIVQDENIWDEIEGDIKYTPFRILPITIESCL